MELAQALTVHDGDYVVSKLSGTLRPRRVTRMWINDKKTIVQFWIHALAPSGWIDSSAVELPPEGQKWNDAFNRWEPR